MTSCPNAPRAGGEGGGRGYQKGWLVTLRYNKCPAVLCIYWQWGGKNAFLSARVLREHQHPPHCAGFWAKTGAEWFPLTSSKNAVPWRPPERRNFGASGGDGLLAQPQCMHCMHTMPGTPPNAQKGRVSLVLWILPALKTQARYKSNNHLTGGSARHTVDKRGSDAKLGFLGEPGFMSLVVQVVIIGHQTE